MIRAITRFLLVPLLVGVVGCGPKPIGEKKTVGSQSTDSAAGPKVVPPRTESGEEVFTLAAAAEPGERISIEEIKTFLDDPKNHETIRLKVPLGLGDVNAKIPADNPLTRAKAELGRMLYFDRRLSRNSTISCATCHEPATGWAQHAAVATGINGAQGGRNSPTVLNRALGKTQFWDGRAASLEEQSLGPIQNPIEMGFTLPELIERLNGIEGYKLMFEKVFGEVSPENIAKAIASFERTALTGGAPNDYYTQAESAMKLTPEEIEDLEEEDKARVEKVLAEAKAHPMSEAALRGRELFFKKAECSLCHVGENLTDELFHNIGIGMEHEKPDEGRFVVSKNPEDTGAFKTPSLRDVALTGPYMHDGSDKTLLETIEFYDQGGTPNPHLSKRIRKLGLSKQDKDDLVVFLTEGLAGELPDIRAPRLPK